MKKLIKFVPLFVIVLMVYNLVIFAKPEWMLEPELFDSSHSLKQTPIPAAVPQPATEAAQPAATEAAQPAATEAAQPAATDAAQPAAAAPGGREAPEEFPAEYIDLSARPIASILMPSGVKWKPIAADVLLFFAVLVLYLELYKTTRIGSMAKYEHFLSALVFLIFLAEFLFIKRCATSTFGIVMLLSLIDVIGGIAISRAMRRKTA